MRSRSSGDGVYQKGMGAIRSSGGLLERAGKALAILIILALGAAASGQNKAWHQLMSTNAGPETMPGPRFGQASLVMNTEKLYWEFGGQDETGELLGDTWIYDFTWELWQLKHARDPTVPSPAPRAYATLVQLSANLYLYGGMCQAHPELAGGKPCSDDLWVYDLTAPQRPWSQVRYTVGAKPPPRSGHVALSFSASMFVYGGSGGAQYGREADRAPDYSSNVWEFKYATVQWVKHVVAVGSVSPLPAFGMAGTLLLDQGRVRLLVHGGVHLCTGGKCRTPAGARTEVNSYVRDAMYIFDFEASQWTEWTLVNSPSRAFHSVHAYKQVDGKRELYVQGGWGHTVTSPDNPALQMQAQPGIRNDLWLLRLDGMTNSSAWKEVVPGTSVIPPARMAGGSGLLGGSAPSLVVAGGLGCNVTSHDIDDCDTVLDDLWIYDLWGWMVGEGTVHMEATHDSGPHKPDAFMLLVAGSIAAQRSGVQTASFRDVQRGEVTGLMWDHGMVMDEMTVHLEAGETVTMSLAVSKPVLHLMTLYREDGASLIPLARVTVDIWDPMYKAEFDGGWRAFEPILAASGGNLFTNERGEVAMHLHPTEWPKLPHQLHSSYRITCFVGTAMVYQDSSFTVPNSSAPRTIRLISKDARTPAFEMKLPPAILKPGERSEPVRTGGQLEPYQYVYVDIRFDYVREGQQAVVQVLSVDEKENRFTLYGAESDRIAYPVEGQHSYAACVDGKGTGVQADKFNAARTHPVCALTWRFSQGVANLHLRVGVKGWAGGDSAPTGRTAYRIEAFYQDTSISTSTPAVATSFLSEDVDYYKSGVDFVVLAISLTLAAAGIIGCCCLRRVVRKQKKISKFKELKFSDLLIFQRPNHEIDQLVVHEMEHALKTAPKFAGETEMSPLKIPVPIPGAPPHGVRTAKPPGSHPVPLRSKYAQDGDGYPPASTDGVRGFMDNLEAMAAEYRRGLFGGEPQVATMSKSEAASTLRSRYEVLHAENRAAQLEGLASAAVVMPKPPPKAPPGIAPPKPPGGGLSSPPVSTARLAGAAVSVDDSRATPPTPPRPPPGISPPTSQPPSRPVSANPFPGSPSSPQPGTPGKAPKAILPPRPRAAVGDASHDIPSLPPTAMQLPAPQAWLATQAAQASKLPDIPNPAPPKIAPPPGVLPSSSSVPNSHSPSRRESVTGSGSVPISHLFRRTGAQGPLAPPKLAGSPRAVLAPPPPPGLSAAIWVTHGPGGQRPPPPPGQPLNLAPAVGPPNRGRRAGSVPPIPREQLGEDELIALRMRALEGLENPGRQRNTGKRNGRSKGGKNK